jgi:hypothetical protein
MHATQSSALKVKRGEAAVRHLERAGATSSVNYLFRPVEYPPNPGGARGRRPRGLVRRRLESAMGRCEGLHKTI